jgi:uncharacterized membrane protein
VNRDEILVSGVLRAGVVIAAAFCAIGALVYFAHPTPPRPYDTFVPATVAPGWNGLGLMAIGVLVLLATPVVRVALLILVFARERDWLYSLVSAIVLGVLTLGLLG